LLTTDAYLTDLNQSFYYLISSRLSVSCKLYRTVRTVYAAQIWSDEYADKSFIAICLTLRGAREKTHRGAQGAGSAFFH
jgi:hypothetical protein